MLFTPYSITVNLDDLSSFGSKIMGNIIRSTVSNMWSKPPHSNDLLLLIPSELLLFILHFLDVSSMYSLKLTSKKFNSNITIQTYFITRVSIEINTTFSSVTNCQPLRPVRKLTIIGLDAIANGHQYLYKYLVNKKEVASKTCIFEVEKAAANGHVNILKYLYEHGCIWDLECYSIAASRNGHLEVMKYLTSTECPLDYDECSVNAAANGHVEILQYLCDIGYVLGDIYISRIAIKNNQLEILKWLHKNYSSWYNFTCAIAAEHGNLEILKYLREIGCCLDEDVYVTAAANGHLEIIKYLRTQFSEDDYYWSEWNINDPSGYSFNEVACIGAVRNGHLEVLEYIHTYGCPCRKTQCKYCK